jgi:hypothetical protein
MRSENISRATPSAITKSLGIKWSTVVAVKVSTGAVGTRTTLIGLL